MESCPSWSKEHDWKSCKRPKPFRGFESLALRQKTANLPLGKFVVFLQKLYWDSNPLAEGEHNRVFA